MGSQYGDKFFVCVSDGCQTPVSSVFDPVLHFLSTDPREAILRNWRLAYVATYVIYHRPFRNRATHVNIPVALSFRFEDISQLVFAEIGLYRGANGSLALSMGNLPE